MSDSSPFDILPLSGPRELLARTTPVSASLLAGSDIDASTASTVELDAGTELYNLVCAALAKRSTARHFSFDVSGSKDGGDEDCCSRAVTYGLGLGLHRFEHDGTHLMALHQTLGEVVGTDCGATLLRSLVLLAPNGQVDTLKSFCDRLLHEADQCDEFKFTVYRFHVQYHYWRRDEVVAARPVESVVLPQKLKRRVLDDLDEFLAPGTKAWYAEHGIPYKHSLLLYGSPGAGKTSLVQALAGHYKRNVCYLSPSHPEMTDDALKNAVQRVPAKSIIVLEDVDALFGEGRSKSAELAKSSLTFSGVLNALDGVGGSSGQIFVLTTNHREKLDPALIRNGRVDCHVEFTDATEEQMTQLFKTFYPHAPTEQPAEFASGLVKLLDGRTVSMAALQAYFIRMRKKSATEAVEGIANVIEEGEAHGGLKKPGEKDETKEEDMDVQKDDSKKAAKDDKQSGESQPATKAKGVASKEMHVHVHIHNGD